jgi:hypothetical protein
MLENIPQNITAEDNELLTKEISEEEMFQTIRSLEQDKSPGPYNFSIRFYKHFWGLIKHDLRCMLNYTLRKKKVGGATDSTFLALIPKETNPSIFSRFRPIFLCNSSYKILTKIISSRLKPLLSKMVSENQGGFMENKQITYNIILVQEAIHSSRGRKDKGMVLKLDMENVFDRVKHSFLSKVLNKYGFSSEFIDSIKACIGSPWIAPMINVCSTQIFKSSRGLR